MSPLFINPPELPPAIGYNHGVLTEGGKLLFVAGQVGADDPDLAGDFPTQFGNALQRVKTVVEAAGGCVEHIARMTIYVTDMNVYLESRKTLSPIYHDIFGKHFPAMSTVEVSALLFPYLHVEIEATAVIP